MDKVGFSEAKRRIKFLRSQGFEKSTTAEYNGFVVFFKYEGFYGLMYIDGDEVLDKGIVYFDDYVKNCVKHAYRKTYTEGVKRMLYGGSLDD